MKNLNEIIDGAYEVRDLIFVLEKDNKTDRKFKITDNNLLDSIDAVIDRLEMILNKRHTITTYHGYTLEQIEDTLDAMSNKELANRTTENNSQLDYVALKFYNEYQGNYFEVHNSMMGVLRN